MLFPFASVDTAIIKEAKAVCKEVAPWDKEPIYDQITPNTRLKIECHKGELKKVTVEKT